MGYEKYEIEIATGWLPMLASLRVGDRSECDPKDRSKIATSISNGMHAKNRGRFITYLSKDKSILYVERTA